MVELELLQRRRGAVALLGQLQPPALGLVGLVEPVVAPRLAQEGQRDEDDTPRSRAPRPSATARSVMAAPAPAPAVALDEAPLLARASGQSATSAPSRKTSPASQIRFTSGLTKHLEVHGAVAVDLLGDHEQVLAGQQVAADADLVRDLLLAG